MRSVDSKKNIIYTMQNIKYKIDGFLINLTRELINEMNINVKFYEHTYRIRLENRYIQLVPDGLSRNIHFEFWRDHWALHLENTDKDEVSYALYQHLQNKFSPNNFLVWNEMDYIKELRVNRSVESIEEFIAHFKKLYTETISYIDAFKNSTERDRTNIELSNAPHSTTKQKTIVHEIEGVEAKIKSISEIFNNNLRIPDYQRPYVWETSNVIQLLNDINESHHAHKSHYRIGSLILHYNKDKERFDIVDGQQRITTLLLIYKACIGSKSKNSPIDTCLRKIEFKHILSFEHIKKNYDSICDWLDKSYIDPIDFWKYIHESCEMVQITVTELSEAFQMFDTQNGRGKSLEAYNLLKAYHIRAMEQNTHKEKTECDKRWEAATLYDATPTIKDGPNVDVLKQLFSEQMYRSRVWIRDFSAGSFSNAHIDEFKGVTIDKNHEPAYPYQSLMLLQYLTSKFYTNVIEGVVRMPSRFKGGDADCINPFVTLNQEIINGKAFFEYVETYTEIYKQMFLNLSSYNLQAFKQFYISHCLDYGNKNATQEAYTFKPRGKACRSGDTYLRELYKSLMFFVFDRFGEEGLSTCYELLYQMVYIQRLLKEKVTYSAVAKLPHGYFKAVARAKNISELETRLQQQWGQIQDTYKDSIGNIRKKVQDKEFKAKLPKEIILKIINHNYSK